MTLSPGTRMHDSTEIQAAIDAGVGQDPSAATFTGTTTVETLASTTITNVGTVTTAGLDSATVTNTGTMTTKEMDSTTIVNTGTTTTAALASTTIVNSGTTTTGTMNATTSATGATTATSLTASGATVLSNASITIANLGTVDPTVAGRLWSNKGVVTVSAGGG